MPAADLSSTRRVSLGRKDKCDLQVVALERQESFSSSSTDYEEIDLSERIIPDSEANDSGSNVDDAESDKRIEIDSHRDDQEMESKEDSDGGRNKDDVENNDVLTDEENNSVLTDDEDFGDNVVLTDEGDVENNISTDEDDVENSLDLSDEDSGEDVEESSQNYLEALEALEDELHDSANEINVLNDISITIANESLVSHSPTNLDEHLEIVDDEVEDNVGLNQGNESDNESLNELHMTSTQRIVVSQSDSEDESDGKVENETEMMKGNQCASGSEMIVDQPVVDNHDIKEKKDTVVSSTIASSEKENTEVLASKSKSKNILKAEKPTDLIPKPSLKVVKNTISKLSSAEKTELVTSSNLKKDKTQEMLPKDNTVDKAKETKEPRNDKGTLQKGNEKVSGKAADHESKVKVSANKESKVLSTEHKLKTETEEKMDFDQLSIEDEDSDFEEEEEEENQPAVKSKIGLSKIPAERIRRKRSYSSENDRTKRHSRSPERSRASSRSYRDRQRDQRLHDRSREGFSKRRSRSPSTDRRYRGSDSRYQRSRSRDRKQNRISSTKGRDRESRHYRSRSRSNSRTRTSRTEKVLKSNVDKPIKKKSIKSSVKEHLEINKKVNTRPLSTSPRKELRTQDSGNEDKTVRMKQAKSSTIETNIANGSTKVILKPKIQRDVDGVIIKQPKGLCPIL